MERRTNRYIIAAMGCIFLLLILAVYQGIDAHRDVARTAERHYTGQLDSLRRIVDTCYRNFEIDLRDMGNGILVESVPEDYEQVVTAYLSHLYKNHGVMIEDAGVWMTGRDEVFRVVMEDGIPFKGKAENVHKVIVDEKSYEKRGRGLLLIQMPLLDKSGVSRGQVWATIRISDLISRNAEFFDMGEWGYLWYLDSDETMSFIPDGLVNANRVEDMNLPQSFFDRVALGLDGKTTNLMVTTEGRYWMSTSYVVIHVGGLNVPMGISIVARELAWSVDLKLLAISVILTMILGVLIFTFRRIIALETETKESMSKAVYSFNRLIESIPAGIILARTNGSVKYINNAAKRMTGCYDETGLSIEDLCHTESIGNLQSHSIRRDGNLYPVAMAIESIEHDNEPTQVYSFVDISRIEEARILSEASNRTKTEFLTNISHEIKTPMNGILASTQILATTDMDEEQTDLVEIIETSSNQLLGIINQILEHSKIESGKLELSMKPYNMRQQLESLHEMFHIKARNKGLQLIFDVAPTLPDVIIMDEIRIQQIFNNLLNNAVKFTENGMVWVHVSCMFPLDYSPQLIIQVGDTGIGIPKSQQSMIYEPFIQLDGSLKRNFGGTGLGMSIVKDLLDMMQGSIQVESPNPMAKGDMGTLFRLQIPIGVPSGILVEKAEEPVKETGVPELAVVAGMNTLVNESIKHLLQRLGWEVICSEDLDRLVSVISTNIGRIGVYFVMTGENQAFDKQVQDMIYTLDRRGGSKMEMSHVFGIQYAGPLQASDGMMGFYQLKQLKYPVRLKNLETMLME